METRNSRELGQVMILMAVGFVVFLGFVALAIDGGMIYSERRNAQNASDAGSLGGGGATALYLENNQIYYAGWNCSSGGIAAAEAVGIAAAISRADSNGYTVASGISDGNGVTAVCGVDSSHGYEDKYIDVTVAISSTIHTNFAQVVLSSNTLRTRQNAITRVRPRQPWAFGNAIVALNPGACSGNSEGVTFGGSNETHIIGGGVWSNGCLRGNGNNYQVNVEDGGVHYVIDPPEGTMNFDPAPTIADPLPTGSYEVPAPNCSDPNAHHVSGNLRLNNGELELEAGLWCIDGDMVINGGSLTSAEGGVTIYLPTGDVSISGNAEVALAAPTANPDPSPALAGVLFYVEEGDVDLQGNNESSYFGLVYAPNGQIKAHGANGTTPTFNTQFIGWNVDVSGNASIDIRFEANEQASRPSSIELWK